METIMTPKKESTATSKKYLVSYINFSEIVITPPILFRENEIERIVNLLEYAGFDSVHAVEVSGA